MKVDKTKQEIHELQKAQTKKIADSVISTSVESSKKNEGDYNVALTHDGMALKNAYQKAFNIAKNTSPIREDRVNELKKQIASGEYQVDSGKIADGIMNEAMKEHAALNSRV